MCNLYTARVTAAEIAQAFQAVEPTFEFDGSQDLYPKTLAPVVRMDDGRRIVDRMRWGFPPPLAARGPVTNARNLTSPFWRNALQRPDRRCLVPVTSFCEWEGEKGSKVKRWFSVPSRPIFAFAGIWRPSEDGAAFAFLTCEANPIVASVHPQAMPVILHPEDHEGWLGGRYNDVRSLAAPYPSQLMSVA
jgi:putative SOS response-associated peptidase YedK